MIYVAATSHVKRQPRGAFKIIWDGKVEKL
jgi:hypothetical protein